VWFPTEDKKRTGRSSTSENPTAVLQPQGKKLLKHSLSMSHFRSPTDFSDNCHLPNYVPVIRYVDTVNIFAVSYRKKTGSFS